MKFYETKLKGAYIIEIEKLEDERGFFARTWDFEEFSKIGLNNDISQCSISFNLKKGTLRGLHYQIEPFSEIKIISCIRGKIFDVIVDLRKDSATFKQWTNFEISQNDYKFVYIPKGFAHGFQTLEENTIISYQISQSYKPEYARGIRWDDKTFNIKWPISQPVISEKDRSWKFFDSY